MLVQSTKAAAKTKAPVARQQHGSGILAKLDIVSIYTLHSHIHTNMHKRKIRTNVFFLYFASNPGRWIPALHILK